MGWGLGYDNTWARDIGYSVIAWCDHPDCSEVIDRGLSYVCASGEPRGGDGCGLYFCSKHRGYSRCSEPDEDREEEILINDCCERCRDGLDPFEPKPEHPHWLRWKLNHHSWQEWREDNILKCEDYEFELKRMQEPLELKEDEIECRDCRDTGYMRGEKCLECNQDR